MKKLKIILLSFFIVVAVLATCIHLLLTYRAKQIFKALVTDISKGKYMANVADVSYSYFPAGIKIKQLELKPITNNEKGAIITCDFINLKIESVWQLAFEKKLQVKMLHLYRPGITAYAKAKTGTQKKGIAASIKEMQQALVNTFDALNVYDVLIEDAAIKIFTAENNGNYFSLNHLTIGLKEIDIIKNENAGQFELKVLGDITLNNPAIHLADPNVTASLGYLKASTITQDLVIDLLQFNYNVNSPKPDTVSFSSLKASKLNWNRFLDEGIFELDSIQVKKGRATLSIEAKQKTAKSDSAQAKTYAGSSFIIHYADVSDVSYTLQTHGYIAQGKNRTLMKLQGDSLVLKELSVLHGRTPAAKVDELNLRITHFQENDVMNSNKFSLGDIAITQNTLVLKNYLLQAGIHSKYSLGNKVQVEEIRLENYSLEEAMQKKLQASKLTVVQPEVVIDILQKSTAQSNEKKDVNQSIQKIIASLSSKLNIGKIAINNASILMQPQAAPGEEIKLSGLSLIVDGRKVMKANSMMGIIHAVDELSTSGFALTSANTNLQIENVKLLTSPRGLYFGSIKGNFGKDAFIDLHGVTILNTSNTLDLNSATGLHASDIMVDSGTIRINKHTQEANAKKESSMLPNLRADRLKLGKISFEVKNEKGLAVSSRFDLNAKDFLFADKNANWSELTIGSSVNHVVAGTTTFDAGSISLLQPGILEILNASGYYAKKNATIRFSTNKLTMGLGVSSTNIQKLAITNVYMSKPQIDILLQSKTAQEPNIASAKKGFSNSIGLESLTLEDATIYMTGNNAEGKELYKTEMHAAQLQCNNFQLIGDEVAPQILMKSATYYSNKIQSRFAEKLLNPSSVYLKLSNIFLKAQAMQGTIDTLLLKDVKQTIIGKKNDTLLLQVAELGVANMPFKKTDSLDWKQMLMKNKWWANGGNIIYNTPSQLMILQGLQLKQTGQLALAFDSMNMRPRLNRDSFWRLQPFEKDHISISMGHTYSNNIAWSLDSTKPTIGIGKLYVNDLLLTPQRDKTRPEDTVTYRPLLAAQIMSIPLKVKIDSLLLSNAQVRYHEITQKSGKEAYLMIDRIRGSISNIKTYDIKENDSLFVVITSTRLYGKGPLRMNFRQSYTDSLQGFWLRTRMGRFDMQEMNALLLPQIGLRIHTGIIDTLTMIVNGNKYFAYGKMDLRYHNMSVQLMGKGEGGKFFMGGTVNWIVNQILRRHDNGRPNLIFKNRIQKRGQFNYWGKIAVEGLLTNIGVKTDKKEKKNFKKNVHLYKLPDNYWGVNEE